MVPSAESFLGHDLRIHQRTNTIPSFVLQAKPENKETPPNPLWSLFHQNLRFNSQSTASSNNNEQPKNTHHQKSSKQKETDRVAETTIWALENANQQDLSPLSDHLSSGQAFAHHPFAVTSSSVGPSVPMNNNEQTTKQSSSPPCGARMIRLRMETKKPATSTVNAPTSRALPFNKESAMMRNHRQNHAASMSLTSLTAMIQQQQQQQEFQEQSPSSPSGTVSEHFLKDAHPSPLTDELPLDEEVVHAIDDCMSRILQLYGKVQNLYWSIYLEGLLTANTEETDDKSRSTFLASTIAKKMFYLEQLSALSGWDRNVLPPYSNIPFSTPINPPSIDPIIESSTDSVYRKIAVDRIIQGHTCNGDPLYSLEQIRPMAAETFELDPTEMSFYYNDPDDGSHIRIIDDSDLSEGIQSSETPTLELFVAPLSESQMSLLGGEGPVFLKLCLPQSSRLVSRRRLHKMPGSSIYQNLLELAQESIQHITGEEEELSGRITLSYRLPTGSEASDATHCVIASDDDLKDAFTIWGYQSEMPIHVNGDRLASDLPGEISVMGSERNDDGKYKQGPSTAHWHEQNFSRALFFM